MTTTATAPLASISPRSLADSLERDPADPLIDVRTSLEYREVHVPQAENIPLDELDPAALAKRFDRGDQPVYVICQSGGRGAKACERLRAVLKAPVVNVAGGTAAW
ncbi:MAG TPA: rhodanese-like domain-containing protein, partial [Lacipirellulaceae bacterium]|nr:rhodanese-like domain-containing protein [Lacipirellulaceae bacterium]